MSEKVGHPEDVTKKRKFDDEAIATTAAGGPRGRGEEYLVARAKEELARFEPPLQSLFRVVCIVDYYPREAPKKRHTFVGANFELCNLCGGSCSERTAFSGMRAKHGHEDFRVESLSITTDAPSWITPGPMCRELLCEKISKQTPIHLINGPGAVWTVETPELWKFPSVYIGLKQTEMAEFAKKMLKEEANAEFSELVNKTKRFMVDALVEPSRLFHPIYYVAGMKFSDGSMRFTKQTQAIEYPASIEPIAKMAAWIEDLEPQGVSPSLLVLLDQFGICHAPYAMSRAYLSENGFEKTRLCVHDEKGKIHYVSVKDCYDSSTLSAHMTSDTLISKS